jgi:hypothetical protein
MTWRTNTYERKKLYQEVWAEPVMTVAKRYGVSGVALAKTCRKLAVPVPPRGYWAKIRPNRKAPRPPLPPFRGPKTLTSRIHLIEGPLQSDIEQILENDLNVTIPSPVPVPERIRSPHPLVQQTREIYGDLMPDEYGLFWRRQNTLDLRVSRASLSRALRICDGLIKSTEELGWQVQLTGECHNDTSVTAQGQSIQFGIEEELDRTEHVLTPQEERKKARGEYVRDIKWACHPSGKLRIRIKECGYGDGLRKSWSDSARNRLEEQLDEFLEAIRYYVAQRLATQRERERKAKEKAAIRARLAEFQAKREAAKRRIAELNAHTDAWHGAQRIRAFVKASLEAGVEDEWGRWALSHADRIDPLCETPPPTSEKTPEEIDLEKKLSDLWRY